MNTGIDKARKLQSFWFENEVFLRQFNAALDHIGFTDEYVKRCVGLGSGPKKPDKPKALKDGVWGMMSFTGSDMRLIDSPILQRLRRIRQLGFSYLTYPSAEHSRFPHSVGMAHVVSRFVQAIDEKVGKKPEMDEGLLGYRGFQELQPLTSVDLIHAALLHDVGHLPFSHATESAIEASRDLFTFGGITYDEFKVRAERYLSGELSLSETISIAVTLSPRFCCFYSKYVLDKEDEDAPLRLACLIAGQKVLPNSGNIQDIISSSAVDADKIDYVSRDALACGISVGVDISRVFLGSCIVGLTPEKAKELGYSVEDRHIFALNASGWDTFDEITRARSMLYQRVYLHAVTRTAEAVLARALKLNALASESRVDDLGDAITLWSIHDQGLIDAVVDSNAADVSELGATLRDRILPKKACALGAVVVGTQVPIESVLPSLFGGADQVNNIIAYERLISSSFQKRFMRGAGDINSLQFEKEVSGESVRIAEVLKASHPKLAPSGNLDSAILITIAALDQRTLEAPVFQHGELVSAGTFTNVRGTSDAADMFRQIGFVMAPREWREIVLVATRNVLYRESLKEPARPFEVQNGSSPEKHVLHVKPTTILSLDGVIRRVGVPRREFGLIMEALEGVGDFDENPILARPYAKAACHSVSSIFKNFQGERGWNASTETLAAFIDQFPPKFRTPLIRCLEQSVYLSRDQLDEILHNSLKHAQAKLGNDLVIVPASISSGGAAWATAKARFRSDARFTFAPSLSQAVNASQDGKAIVLLDDNAASGTQLSAQLFNFLGRPRESWPEDLRSESALIDSLDEDLVASLEKASLSVVVAIGHKRAHDKIVAHAASLGLINFKGVSFEQELGAGIEWPPDLQDHLAEIGRSLVAQDRYSIEYDRLPPEKRAICDEHAFGYGNFGGLTFLPTTVPTSTVTALWMPGMWKGRPWIPFALRWGRFKKVAFA